MNKFGVVLGIAAVATLAGCKDPDYKYDNGVASQNEVKNADTTVVVEPAPAPKDRSVVEPQPVITVKEEPKVVTPAPAPVPAPVVIPAEPEYTIYVVQNGDYLAKISKKYNVTIAAIKRLNPSIKNDNIVRIGQKLKLPGRIDVQQSAAAVTAATTAATTGAKKVAKKAYVPYAGATKEYVVKSGDTIGSIAYGNGINIRQFKELNGLSKDTIKVGQKLKIPAKAGETAASVAKKAAAPVVAKSAAVKAEPVTAPAAPAAEKPAAAVAAPASAAAAAAAPAAAPAAEAEAKPAEAAAPAPAKSAATTTYVVQEGDDMTGVSIRWGVSAAEIRELNNLTENDQLVPGQIIKLPAEAQQ